MVTWSAASPLREFFCGEVDDFVLSADSRFLFFLSFLRVASTLLVLRDYYSPVLDLRRGLYTWKRASVRSMDIFADGIFD